MPPKKKHNAIMNEHGPDSSRVVLLIIDMVSDFQFEDGKKLFAHTMKIAKRVAELRKRAQDAGVPVVFVNDNFGKWNRDYGDFVDAIREGSAEGREITDILAPEGDDYFILKPQRSAFYATPLDVLLESMEAERLIITGITTDICVLFTAHDAHMRGFEVIVPEDCAAAVEATFHNQAIKFMERVAEAKIVKAADVKFGKKGPAG
ncbi:MAG TPA: isochorismatase family cysteine hydrolase [Pyrinomonadaceae bacterium]|nr:isochorismatase family cysteine hydrolase [Pyrinomonadaceae bacterium]